MATTRAIRKDEVDLWETRMTSYIEDNLHSKYIIIYGRNIILFSDDVNRTRYYEDITGKYVSLYLSSSDLSQFATDDYDNPQALTHKKDISTTKKSLKLYSGIGHSIFGLTRIDGSEYTGKEPISMLNQRYSPKLVVIFQATGLFVRALEPVDFEVNTYSHENANYLPQVYPKIIGDPGYSVSTNQGDEAPDYYFRTRTSLYPNFIGAYSTAINVYTASKPWGYYYENYNGYSQPRKVSLRFYDGVDKVYSDGTYGTSRPYWQRWYFNSVYRAVNTNSIRIPEWGITIYGSTD